MTMLGSNIRKVQGRVANGQLWSNVSGIKDYSANKINCKGYNSLLLSVTCYNIAESAIRLVGFYPDNNSTSSVSDTLVALDVTKNEECPYPVKRKVEKSKRYYFQRYLIDVSNFDFIGVGKLDDDGAGITCNWELNQNSVNLQQFKYSQFVELVKTDSNLTASNYIKIDNPVVANFLALKYVSTGETPTLRIKAILSGGDILDISEECYELQQARFIHSGYSRFSANTEFFFMVPIKPFYDKIFMDIPNSENTISVGYNFTEYSLEFTPKIVNYWDALTGPIGNAATMKVPAGTKKGAILVKGNPDSVGALLEAFFITQNADVTGVSSKLKSFNGERKLYHLEGDTVIENGRISIQDGENLYLFDPSGMKYISLGGLSSTIKDLKVDLIFDQEPLDLQEKEKLGVNFPQKVSLENDIVIGDDRPFVNTDFNRLFDNKDFQIYKWTGNKKFTALLRDIVVWNDDSSLSISLNGIDGETQEILFNSTNFPNLIAGSTIERVVLMPWTRNPQNGGYGGYQWRMNVITNKGQVYHNFPSRAIDGDGDEQANDYKTFDESCVWELPERKTPVKTNSGNDATLIATGKYRYFPCLPDEAYEIHPGINEDNGFGNQGFPATITKTDKDNDDVTFSRFYFTDRSRGYQGNPLGFMGGFIAHSKLNVIATYKSNSDSTGSTRICVFFSNDGGRNWFCRYEFGANGMLYLGNETFYKTADQTFLPRNLTAIGMAGNAGSGLYQLVRRAQYIPSGVNKEIEKTKKFKYFDPVLITSIVDNTTEIIVNATGHELTNGDVILFEKQGGAASNEWDWIVNTGHDPLNAGDGVLFKAQVIDANSFRLMECVYNPENNLLCRHIHSANRNKDNIVIGAGESYPDGWIIYIPIIPTDSFYRKYPWDKFDFIRLNSTANAIQRPLGVLVKQDSDNTVFIGVDNEATDLGSVQMPAGRTDTFKRSSNGVFKGRLVDVDDQALFECVFESKEVCYLFKEIYGKMLYMGQQGHFGMSKDDGASWSQCHLNQGDLSRFGGTSTEGYICIDNYLILAK